MRWLILFGFGFLASMVASFACAQDALLKDLGDRYEAQKTKYRQGLDAAETPEARIEVFETLDPRNVFVDEFLEIEKAHRGSPAAVSALYNLMLNALGMGDPDAPASQGRVKAIELLREHYIDHPDLDLLLGFLRAGAYVPQAEGFLREATRSSQEHVRIAALYHLTHFLQHKATFISSYAERPVSMESGDGISPRLAEYHRKNRALIKELGPIDVEEVLEEAARLAEEVLQADPEAHHAYARREGPGELSIRRLADEEYGTNEPPKFHTMAESLLFELRHLQEGQEAPDIVGTDPDELEFKLSDYRGRVVLLMFSAGWCGPCKAMYPELRKLQEVFADQPFTVLAVMGDFELETVIRATTDGDICWRTWFDGNQGPIATQWNVRSWPTLYLLDHNGVIIDDEPSSDFAGLKKSIEVALVTRSEDPDADDLLAAHAVPDLPIVKQAEEAAVLRNRAELRFELEYGVGRSARVAFDRDERLMIVNSNERIQLSSSDDAQEELVARLKKAVGKIQVWDVQSREVVREFQKFQGVVGEVAISPDDRFLVTVNRPRDNLDGAQLQLWDFQSGDLLKDFPPLERQVLVTKFSPDGSLLATGGFDKNPRVWSIPSCEEVTKLPEQPSFSDCLEFTPDGRLLVVPSRKGDVTVWNTESWTLQKQFQVDDFFLLGAALSPDGKVFAVGGAKQEGDQLGTRDSGIVVVWDLDSGEVLSELETEGLVSGLSFSADGSLLAAIGMSPNLTIWEWEDKRVHALIPLETRTSGSEVDFLHHSGLLMINNKHGRLSFYKIAK